MQAFRKEPATSAISQLLPILQPILRYAFHLLNPATLQARLLSYMPTVPSKLALKKLKPIEIIADFEYFGYFQKPGSPKAF